MLIVSLSVFLGALAALDQKSVLFSILGILYFLILMILPLRFIFILLIITIFIDKSPVSFAGSFVRIYQLIFIPFFIKLLINQLKEQNFVNIPLKHSLFFWYMTFFLALPHVLSVKDFYIIIIGQAFLYLLYYAVYSYYIGVDDKNIQLNLIKYYILGGLLIVFLGLVEFPLLSVGLIEGYDRGIGIKSPSSLMREPDWYGVVCMYFALILSTLSLFRMKLFQNRITLLLLFACIVGLILSMARAAWLGFGLGISILFVALSIKHKIKLFKKFSVLIFISLVLFTLFALFQPSKAEVVLSRINPYTTMHTDNGAANSRVASMLIMIDFIKLHPWVGNGAGGMAKVATMDHVIKKYIDGEINAGRGNANLILTSLFDSGIIGTFFLVTFITIYIKIMIKRYRETRDPIILSFLISFIGILIDFMLNNGIRFGFFWVHIALSLAYANKNVYYPLNNKGKFSIT
ncbi:O-antigen ligase family protein [Anoxybacillus suryakundensis]